jgi:hypothetical protein
MKWIALTTLILGLMTGSPRAQSPLDLSQYQWTHRLLLIFAPSEQNPAYLDLEDQLQASEAELADRDLIVFRLFAQGRGSAAGAPIGNDSVSSLYKLFDVQQGASTVVLIGKDGGEKARQVDAFDLQAIFERIDAMPMRQREMRQQKRD